MLFLHAETSLSKSDVSSIEIDVGVFKVIDSSGRNFENKFPLFHTPDASHRQVASVSMIEFLPRHIQMC